MLCQDKEKRTHDFFVFKKAGRTSKKSSLLSTNTKKIETLLPVQKA
jgi:hypothetical protein